MAFILKSKVSMPLGDALPFYFLFAALPLPLVYPLYFRYLKGSKAPKARSRRYHVALAIAYAAIFVAYLMSALHTHWSGWSWVPQTASAAFWAVMSIDHLHRAAKIATSQPVAPS
jgi:hypothetical protein